MRRLTWTPTRPPVSLRYGQRDSGDFPGTWQHTRATSKADGSRLTRHVYTESPAGLRITAAVRKFEGFDALDWVVELENLGTADTPILQDILPLDTTFTISPFLSGWPGPETDTAPHGPWSAQTSLSKGWPPP